VSRQRIVGLHDQVVLRRAGKPEVEIFMRVGGHVEELHGDMIVLARGVAEWPFRDFVFQGSEQDVSDPAATA
jgi:hypothetical protein